MFCAKLATDLAAEITQREDAQSIIESDIRGLETKD